MSDGSVIKYGDLLNFSDAVPAKKSRTWSKESPTCNVKGEFVFIGFEVPVSATGKESPRGGGLLLHSVAKLGNRGRLPWCSFLKASYNSKKVVCEAADAPTFNVPIHGALGGCSIHVFSIDGGAHRSELLGAAFSSSIEMQLARSPMQASARQLTFPISTATYFGTRDNVDVATTLLHSMTASASRRILDDYLHVGPLSKPAMDDGLGKYMTRCAAALASVANLKLVSAKVLKALAGRFQLEFTPHFKSAALERSQAAAGKGGSMADSHVPSLAGTRGRGASSTTPARQKETRDDESPVPTLRKSGLQLPGSAERALAAQDGPAAKRSRAIAHLAGGRGDHVLRAGDSPSFTALGAASDHSPSEYAASSASAPSPATLAAQLQLEKMTAEKMAAERKVEADEGSKAKAVAEILSVAHTDLKAAHDVLVKLVATLQEKLTEATAKAAAYKASSDTKDYCISLLQVALTTTLITLTLTLTLTLTRTLPLPLSLTLTRIVAARRNRRIPG
jgi:hypothetical protein